MDVDDDVSILTASPMEVDDDDITDRKVNGMQFQLEMKVVISVCHPTSGTTRVESEVRCETSFTANVSQHCIPPGVTPPSRGAELRVIGDNRCVWLTIPHTFSKRPCRHRTRHAGTLALLWRHMSVMAYQITSNSAVCLSVCFILWRSISSSGWLCKWHYNKMV